jgi:hypothetical protein
MSVTLNDMCTYCERTVRELKSDILANNVMINDPFNDDGYNGFLEVDTRLSNFLINSSVITLCNDCQEKFAPNAPLITPENYTKLAPITFPPGYTSMEHYCPSLEEQGYLDEESLFVMHMESDGRYYTAQCPYCQIRIRSLAVDQDGA